MDSFQGAVLSIKLRYLEEWTERRRFLAARYKELLADLPLQLPAEVEDRRHVWHLFVVLHPERERIRQALEERGIVTSLHYPVPVHLQKAYRHLRYRAGDFPVSERIANECLSLPMFPEMTIQQQDRVVEALHEVVGELG
jgi:dTDP-4-amino-4,6-dideoxygalactose transaminase